MLVLCPEYQTRKSIVECSFSVQNTSRDHLLLSRLLYSLQLWTACWPMQCLVIHFAIDIYTCGRLACSTPSPPWRLDPFPGHGLPFLGFEITLITALGRTPLDEWSVRRSYLYLKSHNTRKRQTSMIRWDSNPQSQQVSGRRPML